MLQQALRRLIIEEWDLAVVGANERTVIAHLSRMITDFGLPEPLRVDNDYNRHMLDRKRAWLDDTPTPGETPIEPDIVIHRRGIDEENILALEAKKARRCSPHDERKIRALVREPYRYEFGVLLGLAMRTNRDESFWNPSWRWLTEQLEEPNYDYVFDPAECAELNSEGRARWRDRL